MRLLLINPNISESVSSLIGDEARRTASPGTDVTVVTAPFGVAYIETRFESLIGAYAVAQLAAEHYPRFDAIVVAAFGDPGLPALREVVPVPVVGMSEAAFASACLIGQRFSIIAISSRITAWYRETVERCGLTARLASIRALDQPLADIGSVQTDQAAQLLALCERAVREDGADALVIAGAPLAGLARQIRNQLPVPAVDGVSCAVAQAEALVRLAPRQSRAGSFSPPPLKPHRGLPESIGRLLESRKSLNDTAR
jgi:Asp/Glu/hydantoin racemase